MTVYAKAILGFNGAPSDSLRNGEIVNGEQRLRINPVVARIEASASRELLKLFDRVLVRIFRMYGFARSEPKRASIDMNLLIASADEMHFDASRMLIIMGAMLVLIDIEIRAELTIDAGQEVQIECGSHALCVVIG